MIARRLSGNSVQIAKSPSRDADSAPQIPHFGRPTQIGAGQCVNISGMCKAREPIVITRGGTAIWDNARRGNMDDCPPGSGTVPYVLTATGPGGTSKQQRDVNVVAQPPTTQPPTATPVVPPTPAPQPQ
jgi:hypothetical protein